MRRPPSKLVLPWNEPLPLSKAACGGGWRFTEKWCSGLKFVAARDAKRHFGSVRTAIADSAIAVWLAAPKFDAANTAQLTAATSGVWRAGWIIATASGVQATSRAGSRDGSRFPFGHFSGTIRLWRNDRPAGCGPAAIQTARRAGRQPLLWLRCSICGRPGRFVDPFPQIPRRK